MRRDEGEHCTIAFANVRALPVKFYSDDLRLLHRNRDSDLVLNLKLAIELLIESKPVKLIACREIGNFQGSPVIGFGVVPDQWLFGNICSKIFPPSRI